MRFKRKEHVHKHTCIIFVILFDDKEGEYKKSHIDLGRIPTAPRGTTQSKSPPSWGICKDFLIPEACGDGRMDMLRRRETGNSNSSCSIGVCINNYPLRPQEKRGSINSDLMIRKSKTWPQCGS